MEDRTTEVDDQFDNIARRLGQLSGRRATFGILLAGAASFAGISAEAKKKRKHRNKGGRGGKTTGDSGGNNTLSTNTTEPPVDPGYTCADPGQECESKEDCCNRRSVCEKPDVEIESPNGGYRSKICIMLDRLEKNDPCVPSDEDDYVAICAEGLVCRKDSKKKGEEYRCLPACRTVNEPCDPSELSYETCCGDMECLPFGENYSPICVNPCDVQECNFYDYQDDCCEGYTCTYGNVCGRVVS